MANSITIADDSTLSSQTLTTVRDRTDFVFTFLGLANALERVVKGLEIPTEDRLRHELNWLRCIYEVPNGQGGYVDNHSLEPSRIPKTAYHGRGFPGRCCWRAEEVLRLWDENHGLLSIRTTGKGR
jgi:hypothetical protein